MRRCNGEMWYRTGEELADADKVGELGHRLDFGVRVASVQVADEHAGIAVMAEEDEGISERLELGADPRFQALRGLRVMV